MPEAIYNTKVYFNNVYKDEWLLQPLSQKMIKSIDKSTVLSSGAIDSPYFGVIPPTKLSGGVKTLILIENEPNVIFNASMCCDKCAKWILKIAKDKDVTINLNHIMDFGEKFEVFVMNENRKIDDRADYIITACQYV